MADDLVREIANLYAYRDRILYLRDPDYTIALARNEQEFWAWDQALWRACGEAGSTYGAAVRRTLSCWDASEHRYPGSYTTPDQLRSGLLDLLLLDVDESPPHPPEISPAEAASTVLARWLRPGDALSARYVMRRQDEHLPRSDPHASWEYLATVTHADGTVHEARGRTIAGARFLLATVLAGTWLADELSGHGWRVDRGGDCPYDGEACWAMVAEPPPGIGANVTWLFYPDVVSGSSETQGEWLRAHAGWHVGGRVRLVSLPLSGPGDWRRVVAALDDDANPIAEIEAIDDDSAYEQSR